MRHFKTTKAIHGTLGERKKNGDRSWNGRESRKSFSFLILISSVSTAIAVGYGGSDRVPSKATK
jgi:hypothetical protein